MTGIVWCNTFIEGAEQLERIEEQYKAMRYAFKCLGIEVKDF